LAKGQTYYTFRTGNNAWMSMPGGCCSSLLLLFNLPCGMLLLGLVLLIAGLTVWAHALLIIALCAIGATALWMVLIYGVPWLLGRKKRREQAIERDRWREEPWKARQERDRQREQALADSRERMREIDERPRNFRLRRGIGTPPVSPSSLLPVPPRMPPPVPPPDWPAQP
jgi:hypothetical protein